MLLSSEQIPDKTNQARDAGGAASAMVGAGGCCGAEYGRSVEGLAGGRLWGEAVVWW